MITDRPDFTESASTVSPGRFQFEMGYTFTRAGQEDRHNFGEILARVGILTWLEGRLGLNSFSQLRAPGADREGLEDLTISAKAVLYRKPGDSSAAVPQVALLFGVDLPTGESGFGENEVQPGVKIAFDFELTERLNLGSNLGLGLPVLRRPAVPPGRRKRRARLLDQRPAHDVRGVVRALPREPGRRVQPLPRRWLRLASQTELSARLADRCGPAGPRSQLVHRCRALVSAVAQRGQIGREHPGSFSNLLIL